MAVLNVSNWVKTDKPLPGNGLQHSDREQFRMIELHHAQEIFVAVGQKGQGIVFLQRFLHAVLFSMVALDKNLLSLAQD